MTLEIAREVLLICTLINYGLLVLWFLVFSYAHDWIRGFHGRWFRLADEQFDMVHYAGMAIYKLGIFLFNLAPLIALYIIE